MQDNKYLAIDIGASSGRHIIGYNNEKGEMILEEVYRFNNQMTECEGHLTWDIDYIFKEVKNGIKIALKKYPNIKTMSIDTWGVDYVLINGDKTIYPVFAYRDNRTNDVISMVHNIISFDKLYDVTGIQFQPFNTIYQLYCDKINGRLNEVTDFLYIPEYLIYKLTGKKTHELTMASTSGLLDKHTKAYSEEIISALGLNKSLFNKLDEPKTLISKFTLDVAKEVGGNIDVLLCATHDTASAVEGIDMTENSPYISSGTWSLLGIKQLSVNNSKKAQNANYSNEYGPNYIRLQKNIMGLWIIQNLSKELKLDFNAMIDLSRKSSFDMIFDVNDNAFLNTKNMKNEIVNWFKVHKGIDKLTNEDIINSCYHSLAYSYKQSLNELEDITGTIYKKIYIVGGGAKNEYLNYLTGKYTGKEIISNPIEMTAFGNIKVQMES